MSTPCTENKRMHKHRDLIIAWANGAEIEYFGCDCKWHLAEARDFDSELSLRIKPVPRQVFKYVTTQLNGTDIARWDATEPAYANLKLTFNYYTGELENAEVLN